MPSNSPASHLCALVLTGLLLSGVGCRADHRLGGVAGEVCENGPDDRPDECAGWDSWGDYAESLPLPSCPAGEILTITTLGTELDGGESLDSPVDAGAELSFVEALYIAHNRADPITILFDAAIFPAQSPATLILPDGLRLPTGIENVCVDARGRGVILDWEVADVVACPQCMPRFVANSQVYGLQFRNQPGELFLGRDSQVAGCRFNSDGRRTFQVRRPWALDVVDAQVGPGNVIFGSIGVRVTGGTGVVRGNYFGVDPTTMFSEPVMNAVDLSGDLEFHDNVVVATTFQVSQEISFAMSLSGNRFGVDHLGRPLTGASGITVAHTATIGPNNIFRGVPIGIRVTIERGVTLTENSISEVNRAIVFSTVAPHMPPTLTLANSDRVEGTCAVTGLVEIFSDEADAAEVFEGSLRCDPASPWTFIGSLPAGRRITATLTDESGSTSGLSASLPISE